MDPLKCLGDDIMDVVLNRLDPWSLQRCSLVSKRWRTLALTEPRWRKFCEELWQDKVYVPEFVRNRTPMAAYFSSLRDSSRDAITHEEMCSFVWTFRFKHQDLPWMLSHPFWRFMPTLYRRFHLDGSISATANDPIFGRHETVWRFTSASGSADDSDCQIMPGNFSQGKKVRVNHWPALTLSRRPDWGWVMQNHYVIYRSLHGEESAGLEVNTKSEDIEE